MVISTRCSSVVVTDVAVHRPGRGRTNVRELRATTVSDRQSLRHQISHIAGLRTLGVQEKSSLVDVETGVKVKGSTMDSELM